MFGRIVAAGLPKGASAGRSVGGLALAAQKKVLVLEARFHPKPDDRSLLVIVGHVVWSDASDDHPVVQPSSSLMNQTTPVTLLSKLQYLVAVSSPDSFWRLQGLRSQFWSFVAVSAAETGKE